MVQLAVRVGDSDNEPFPYRLASFENVKNAVDGYWTLKHQKNSVYIAEVYLRTSQLRLIPSLSDPSSSQLELTISHSNRVGERAISRSISILPVSMTWFSVPSLAFDHPTAVVTPTQLMVSYTSLTQLFEKLPMRLATHLAEAIVGLEWSLGTVSESPSEPRQNVYRVRQADSNDPLQSSRFSLMTSEWTLVPSDFGLIQFPSTASNPPTHSSSLINRFVVRP